MQGVSGVLGNLCIAGATKNPEANVEGANFLYHSIKKGDPINISTRSPGYDQRSADRKEADEGDRAVDADRRDLNTTPRGQRYT